MLTNQETDIRDNRDLVWNNDFGHCITEAAGRIKKSLEEDIEQSFPLFHRQQSSLSYEEIAISNSSIMTITDLVIEFGRRRRSG